jgi:hypothetical protein
VGAQTPAAASPVTQSAWFSSFIVLLTHRAFSRCVNGKQWPLHTIIAPPLYHFTASASALFVLTARFCVCGRRRTLSACIRTGASQASSGWQRICRKSWRTHRSVGGRRAAKLAAKLTFSSPLHPHHRARNDVRCGLGSSVEKKVRRRRKVTLAGRHSTRNEEQRPRRGSNWSVSLKAVAKTQ